MSDTPYYDYMKSYVLSSLEWHKKTGLIDATRTEREHLLKEGIDTFLELAGLGYYENHGYDIYNDKEWEKQTRSYIEDTIGRKLTERELGAYYGLE